MFCPETRSPSFLRSSGDGNPRSGVPKPEKVRRCCRCCAMNCELPAVPTSPARLSANAASGSVASRVAHCQPFSPFGETRRGGDTSSFEAEYASGAGQECSCSFSHLLHKVAKEKVAKPEKKIRKDTPETKEESARSSPGCIWGSIRDSVERNAVQKMVGTGFLAAGPHSRQNENHRGGLRRR